jgi:hypothetical protein
MMKKENRSRHSKSKTKAKQKAAPKQRKQRAKSAKPRSTASHGGSVLREAPAQYGTVADASPKSNVERLAKIDQCDAELKKSYREKLRLAPSLNRSLVSFQANKTRAVFRWFKYKEAFSSTLVEWLNISSVTIMFQLGWF